MALTACGAQKLGPTENLFHVTLLHQFKELRSARCKSIDSKYVRAAWSFDEAQVRQSRVQSSRTDFYSLTTVGNQNGIAKCLRMWQAGLMANSKLTAREKSRQDRERAKSLENRSRQLMRKAAQLQENSRREDIRQAAAGIAKQNIKGK
jgi:hypothetical protein